MACFFMNSRRSATVCPLRREGSLRISRQFYEAEEEYPHYSGTLELFPASSTNQSRYGN